MELKKMMSPFFFFLFLSYFTTPMVSTNRNIFILGGQSNMVGLGGVYTLPNSTTLVWDRVIPEECQPNPLILSFSSNFTWEKAIEPLHGDGIGPGIPFARSILDSNPEVEIGLVPCAIIGTSIAQWARGSDLYGKMLSRAQMAVFGGGEIRGLLWYQGESDAHLPNANYYKTSFQQFISDLRSDLMLPSLPVIEVAIISGGDQTSRDIVRDAQILTAAELDNVECVDAMGLQLGPDNLHLTTASQVQLGKMLADAYLTIGNVTSTPNNS
ncbi:hypothetical protein ACS0TY_014068 [Phlomoides rotata]